MFGLPADVPVVTRDLVERAKPDPHLFLAAAQLLGVRPSTASWSATACGTCWPPSAPVRSGSGCSPAATDVKELERSGAYRVYADPAEMLSRLEEVGVRP